jgi:hypothetical protein
MIFVIAALATWRITNTLVYGSVLQSFRERVGAYECGVYDDRQFTFLGRQLGCFWCTSLWVSTIVAALCSGPKLETLVWIPALSAVAIMLEQRFFARYRNGSF